MSDEIKAEDQAVVLPVVPEKSSNCCKMSLVISLLVLVLLVAVFCFGYLSISKANRSLKSAIKSVEQQFVVNQNEFLALQNKVKESEQAIQASKNLSAQQAQLVAEWRSAQKGDLAKWHVAEAQYLVNLANDHLQFNHDLNRAKILLQRADQTLANLQDAQLLEIRKSIAADLANLNAAPQNDVTTLYLHVAGLDKQIDQLTFPLNPLKSDEKAPVPQTESTTNLPWWKVGLDKAWLGLQQIVIIRKTGSEALPLTFPEEKIFLYQNLHAQMGNMMWAILQQNDAVYQTSINYSLDWIKRYFAQDNEATKSLLLNLSELQKINIDAVNLNLTATLKLFDDFFAAAKQGQSQAEV